MLNKNFYKRIKREKHIFQLNLKLKLKLVHFSEY